MAGGGPIVTGPAKDYGGNLTAAVTVTCIMAASGGLIFGYDIGISGGVTAMDSFLESFFPGVLARRADAKQDEYCVYDNQGLTSFTSSLYIAGLIASLVAGHVTKAIGRQAVMLLGGATFLVGAAINAAAVSIAMLIVGRLLLGFGVGFTNQATPVYLSEMAPARWRGRFNAGFQLFLSAGVVVANVTNYFASRVRGWGWRLSLGIAAAPAALILVSAFLIPDTPSSLVERGQLDRARAALRRVRGPSADVEAELEDIARSVQESREMDEGAFRRIVRRRYRPHLVMAVAMPLFHQLTGVIIMAFFSPVLFRTVGFGSDSALLGAVILGAVSLGSTFVSMFLVDRYGRRILLMLGGAQMILAQVAVACIMGAKIGSDGAAALPRSYSVAVLVLMCFFSAGFSFSWAPMLWLIPSEIFPIEIRSAGQSISVAVSLGLTFVQTQAFLAMLCRLKFGTFAFYAAWVAVMTAFVAGLLPETRGVPLEAMNSVWERHWYWGKFVTTEGKNVGPD